jgi:NACHT domain
LTFPGKEGLTVTGLEVAATAAGKAVARRAAREWLARRAASDRDKDLTELLRVSLPDRFARRRLERQLADIADSVERRLTPLIEQEYRDLDDADRAAVLHDVVAALGEADLSDEALFAADADPVRLARRVRALMPPPPGLGAAAGRLYDVVLDECCDCLVRIARSLPEFAPRALAETLSRLSRLDEQISAVLARLPARTLDAPAGAGDDAEFERRYLEHLGGTLDEIEMLGLRVDNYRPRATLSIAYISLTATAEDRRRDEAGPLKAGELTRELWEPTTARAETMLARSPRTLLRGQAGSGKSTLLRWIAVTAARGAFTGDLADWNGRVPFLVKLRSHDHGLPKPEDLAAGPLGSLMPRAWVHRVLDGGRGILLVDGVDEVPYGRRDEVRRWLRELLDVYPHLRTIVTARPAAADARWLVAEGFRPLMMEPMTPENQRVLVRRWHAAVRHADCLPCAPEELPGYEGSLLARLESGPHLRALATTPLLAAMLCALNLDRVTQLPRDRMGLYRAVLDMLLERRDVERGIRVGIDLERDQQERLLQELAWWLTFVGRAEMSKATALSRIAGRSKAMPRVASPPEAILDHLLQRSGVIREPVPGRIDFVHRTVQEYLAARQAADDADYETLVARAHLDQWRETVVMAAGHMNAPLRRSLLSGLFDRVDNEPRHARRLRLLVASCLETVPDVSADTRDRVERCVSRLVPPRNAAEARRLAQAGEEILRRLPESLADLTEAQAVATVRTAWLINGPRAMDLLARYAADPRSDVQRELIGAWDYFEPHAYAEQVLADAPLHDGRLRVANPAVLPAVARLRRLRGLAVRLPGGTGLEALAGIPMLTEVFAQGVRPDSLRLLTEHHDLEEVVLQIDGPVKDVAPLFGLPALRALSIHTESLATDLGFLSRLPPLERLTVGGLERIRDFSPLAAQPDLDGLHLHECAELTDVGMLGEVGGLGDFCLTGARLGGPDMARIAAAHPRLERLALERNDWVQSLDAVAGLPLSWLRLSGCSRLTDLGPLRSCQGLTFLTLGDVPFADLEPLSELRGLASIELSGCRRGTDLAPLSGLTGLNAIRLTDAEDGLDLTPLTGLRNLTIRMYEGQRVRGADRLHRTTKILWFTRG